MRSPLAVQLIHEVCEELAIDVLVEPEFGHAALIQGPDGRRHYIRNTTFDLNGAGASEIAKDKGFSCYFLKNLGYPVPETKTFYSQDWCQAIGSSCGIAQGYAFALDIGLPVIVKPNSKSHGIFVTKVRNKREFERAAKAVFKRGQDRVAIVQEFLDGMDYRMVVLDQEVISAYQRLKLSVIGDGKRSIKALMEAKQHSFLDRGRDTRLDPNDFRIQVVLQRHKFSSDSILPSGRKLDLVDCSNLSAGGEAIDITDKLDAGFRSLAVELAKDAGLRYCGIDVISQSCITSPPVPGAYWILEVNASPGLDHYAQVGEAQSKKVRSLYQRVVRSLVGL